MWADLKQWPALPHEVPLEIHIDARDVTDAVESLRIRPGMAKRRRLDVADLQELREMGCLRQLLHVMGKHIHADPLTKPRVLTQQTMTRLVELLRSSYYEAILTSAAVCVALTTQQSVGW